LTACQGWCGDDPGSGSTGTDMCSEGLECYKPPGVYGGSANSGTHIPGCVGDSEHTGWQYCVDPSWILPAELIPPSTVEKDTAELNTTNTDYVYSPTTSLGPIYGGIHVPLAACQGWCGGREGSGETGTHMCMAGLVCYTPSGDDREVTGCIGEAHVTSHGVYGYCIDPSWNTPSFVEHDGSNADCSKDGQANILSDVRRLNER
jgi:hypothetical protein